jgi:DNA modification methylase
MLLETMNCKLFLSDCVDGAKMLGDGSVDLVITDPPYFNHISYTDKPADLSNCENDQFVARLKELWKNLAPKLRSGGIVAVRLHDIYSKSGQYFTLNPLHSVFVGTFPPEMELRHILIWDRYLHKTRKGLPESEEFGTRYEYILVLSKGMTKLEQAMQDFFWNPVITLRTQPKFLGSKTAYRVIFQMSKSTFIEKLTRRIFERNRARFVKETHSFGDYKTTIPEDIVRLLIRKFSARSDTVLDPFLGSGTVMQVANELGRNCIGFEISGQAEAVIKRRVGAEIEVHYP